MVTTSLPKCPKCKQSATGVYNRQLGCTRCRSLSGDPRRPADKVAPEPLPPSIPFLPRSALFSNAANPTAVAV